MKKIVLITLTLLLTGCSTGGLSKSSENSFVSGRGSAFIVKELNRTLAPEISGEILSGGNLESVTGKVVVLNVWASWCSPCRAEAPTLEAFARANPDIAFVGLLTRDNLTSAQRFVERFKISYPSLLDDSIIAKFRGSLPANAIPTTIVIDSKGRVAARISGEATVAVLSNVLTKVSGRIVHA